MSPRAKVQAGGIIRKSLDNTWQTPDRILERVRAYFGGEIPFDPSTAKDNPTRAQRYCAGVPGTLFASNLPAEDLAGRNGLEVAWDWPWFCNPPYGTELKAWLAKMGAEEERRRDVDGIALIPASRWETRYFQTLFSSRPHLVCWHLGRVAFKSSKDGKEVAGNCSGSLLVGFNADSARFIDAFEQLGACFIFESAVAFARASRVAFERIERLAQDALAGRGERLNVLEEIARTTRALRGAS